MENQFIRTEQLLGHVAMERLAGARVAVFGIGGVGGYTVEALARSGVGALDLIDSDCVALSNLNRQIIATRSTVGRYKVDVMKERILEIHPDCQVTTYPCFFLPENQEQFPFSSYDYIVDAVDTVTAKLALVEEANRWGVPIISCMGAGNKLDPTAFEVADISKTSVCPLARVMRRELKKRGISKLKVVYSKEPALVPEWSREAGSETGDAAKGVEKETEAAAAVEYKGNQNRPAPGSVAFVPSVAGLILAGEVIKDIAKA